MKSSQRSGFSMVVLAIAAVSIATVCINSNTSTRLYEMNQIMQAMRAEQARWLAEGLMELERTKPGTGPVLQQNTPGVSWSAASHGYPEASFDHRQWTVNGQYLKFNAGPMGGVIAGGGYNSPIVSLSTVRSAGGLWCCATRARFYSYMGTGLPAVERRVVITDNNLTGTRRFDVDSLMFQHNPMPDSPFTFYNPRSPF